MQMQFLFIKNKKEWDLSINIDKNDKKIMILKFTNNYLNIKQNKKHLFKNIMRTYINEKLANK